AGEVTHREPELAAFILANILNHTRLEHAICHRLAQRLDHDDINADLIRQTFLSIVESEPEYGTIMRADLAAVYDRDPACSRLIDPLLYFKGFHALETHRFSHSLWHRGRRDFALYLQSQSSRVFGIDIHPAAKIGQGIMFDHGSGIVIGETAEIGDNSSLLHSVTLGGSGKEAGNRHPKVGRGVMIGAGSKILGNIHIGDCARVAAGSVVLKDVPPKTTVAGVPARVVGEAGCSQPSRMMDQLLQGTELGGVEQKAKKKQADHDASGD
ncbi:MAG: serine O-acetyltransferase, partial [Rhodomicrobium sp.]|nr:serine O-acetyltransferase [Rhodomicrobium sp.]